MANAMLEQIGRKAKDAETILRSLETSVKNKVLVKAADDLRTYTDTILKANGADVARGKEKGMPEGLLDRLTLTGERIQGMAEGLYQLAELEDPVGEVLGMKKRPNGLLIGQKESLWELWALSMRQDLTLRQMPSDFASKPAMQLYSRAEVMP